MSGHLLIRHSLAHARVCVPSAASANDSRTDPFTETLGGLLLVFVLEDVIYAGKSLDFDSSDLPSTLHNPGQGSIEPRRLFFDFLQHFLWEVEALLPFVGLRAFVRCLDFVSLSPIAKRASRGKAGVELAHTCTDARAHLRIYRFTPRRQRFLYLGPMIRPLSAPTAAPHLAAPSARPPRPPALWTRSWPMSTTEPCPSPSAARESPETRPSLTALAALTLAAFGGGALAGRLSHASARDESPYSDFGQLGRVLVLVENQYVEPVDHKKVVEGAIKGMVRELDPHSAYMPPEDFRLFQSDTEGKFGGVGVEVDLRDDAITVIAPIEGSPAERAGIRSGDRIVAVDGQGARGEPLDKLIRKLRGAPGTKVQIGGAPRWLRIASHVRLGPRADQGHQRRWQAPRLGHSLPPLEAVSGRYAPRARPDHRAAARGILSSVRAACCSTCAATLGGSSTRLPRSPTNF